MGKLRQRQKHHNHHDNPKRGAQNVARRQHSQKVLSNVKAKLLSKSKSTGSGKGEHHQQKKDKIPFREDDQLLLVGEGNFSFTLSLVQHYKIGRITSTSFDTQNDLEQKYPDIHQILSRFETSPSPIIRAASKHQKDDVVGNEAEWTGFSPAQSDESSEDSNTVTKKVENVILLHGIDATKLSTTHKKALKQYSPFTKIVFNFPHVGGLSTDVNRQVRANQELLVGFFKAAQPLLVTPSNPTRPLKLDNNESDEGDEDENSESEKITPTQGQILVTLFEGEPYTLWNIRDLARHCGLQLIESFKFPWSAYPGYRHARTIGDIRSGKDRSEEGKRRGAWRGEERDARCYVLALKEVGGTPQQGSGRKRKRSDEEDNVDSD